LPADDAGYGFVNALTPRPRLWVPTYELDLRLQQKIGAPPGGTPPAYRGRMGTKRTRFRAQNGVSRCPEQESIRFKSPLGPNRMWLVTRADSSEAKLLFSWRGTRGAHAARVGVLMPPVRVGVVAAVEPAPHGSCT